VEIHLPLPKSGLTDSYSLRFDDTKISAADLNMQAVIEEKMSQMAGAVNLKDATALWRGAIVDPDVTPLFKGIELRTFSFTWELLPRNAADAANMIAIVQQLKKDVKPTIKTTDLNTATSDYLFPKAFGIEFYLDGISSNKNPLLPDMRSAKGYQANWVCTNLSIEAGGGAPLITFGAGVVTAITIKMEFKEITRNANANPAAISAASMGTKKDSSGPWDNPQNREQNFGPNPQVTQNK
jgi:hypothetical protein